VVLPARSQVATLERHVNRLAASVDALNTSRDDVTKATSLLARLEGQAARLITAETTVERIESLATRLIAEADQLTAAETLLGRLDDLQRSLGRQGETLAVAEATLAQLDTLGTHAVTIGRAAVPVAEQLSDLAATLSARSDESQQAIDRAEQLVTLESRLVETAVDARAADAALVRLTDLAEMLSGASGTVGQLQRFVVEVMLLEPAVGRAMRALEPVVEFTRGEQQGDGKNVKARSASMPERATDPADVTELARTPSDESR
jgi:chromosome segregation ATPase